MAEIPATVAFLLTTCNFELWTSLRGRYHVPHNVFLVMYNPILITGVWVPT